MNFFVDYSEDGPKMSFKKNSQLVFRDAYDQGVHGSGITGKISGAFVKVLQGAGVMSQNV